MLWRTCEKGVEGLADEGVTKLCNLCSLCSLENSYERQRFFWLLKFSKSIDPEGGADHKSKDKSNTGGQSSRVRMGCNQEVEVRICCLVPGSVGNVVTAASILGAGKRAVGKGPGESSSDASLDSGKTVACECLEVFVWLEVLDVNNVLSLGVGNDKLEANEVFFCHNL